MPGRVNGILSTLNERLFQWSLRDTRMLPRAGSSPGGHAQAEAQPLRTLVKGFPVGFAA